MHPPKKTLAPIFLIRRTKKHNAQHDDDQSAHMKRSSKTQKRKDVQVAACLILASYGESISSVQFKCYGRHSYRYLFHEPPRGGAKS